MLDYLKHPLTHEFIDSHKHGQKNLTETDTITKYILPAIINAGWNKMLQVRQEVKLRDGKMIIRGQLGLPTRFYPLKNILSNAQQLRDKYYHEL